MKKLNNDNAKGTEGSKSDIFNLSDHNRTISPLQNKFCNENTNKITNIKEEKNDVQMNIELSENEKMKNYKF